MVLILFSYYFLKLNNKSCIDAEHKKYYYYKYAEHISYEKSY